eukprot:4080348-Prymnesium_polylepis.1
MGSTSSRHAGHTKPSLARPAGSILMTRHAALTDRPAGASEPHASVDTSASGVSDSRVAIGFQTFDTERPI